METTPLWTDSRAAANIILNENKKRRALFGKRKVVLRIPPFFTSLILSSLVAILGRQPNQQHIDTIKK
ncbi:MAG: hypothetical protein JSS93_02915 [Bacteroidetes bacterium]|nr:hypothetical protein [Bacteroidota bacterium]